MNDTRRRPGAMETIGWITCTRLVSRWLAVPAARALNEEGLDATNRLRLVDASSPRGKLQSFFEVSRQFTREVQTGEAEAKLSILLQGVQHISKRIILGTRLRITRENQFCGPMNTCLRPATAASRLPRYDP